MGKSYNWSRYINKSLTIDFAAEKAKGNLSPINTINTIINNIDPKKIKTILELGCSAGIFCNAIKAAIRKEIVTYGIDNDTSSKKFSLLDRHYIGDVFNYKFKRKFDLVFSLGLIEHFNRRDREKLFTIHKNLSSRYIAIGFPNVSFSIRYIHIKLRDDLIGGNHHYYLSQKEITELANKHNLKTLYFGYISNYPTIQKLFRLHSTIKNKFFCDYFLGIYEKP